MTVVVDANVIIKLFVEEPLSEVAKQVFADDDQIMAPAHFLGEVGEVLLRRRRAGDLSAGQVETAFIGLANAVIPIPLDDLLPTAFLVAERASVSFYDALYVAGAVSWGAHLVTADLRLLAAIDATPWRGVTVSLIGWPRARRASP